jgi:DNA mismatch endonuclease (patch repair protein)
MAVFVDGCYWHGCPEHSPSEFKGPNAERWREKIETNRRRDERNTSALESMGWSVLRIWECEIRNDIHEAASRVRDRARASTQ